MSRRARRIPDVPRKSDAEIELMREAGRIVGRVLQAIEEAIQPGINTAEIDKLAEEIIVSSGARPSFKGYRGYPATICADPDDIVVHGIPSEQMVLAGGMLFGVDVGAHYQGYHGDAAMTWPVGDVSPERLALLEATQQARDLGIAAAQPGNRLREISAAVQHYVEACGFSVVRDLVGHGIGRQMHEPPQVPNFVAEGQFVEYDLVLRPGMTLAIEPMINAGGPAVRVDQDGWTVRTADGRPSAHFEHTVAVGREGPQILTLP